MVVCRESSRHISTPSHFGGFQLGKHEEKGEGEGICGYLKAFSREPFQLQVLALRYFLSLICAQLALECLSLRPFAGILSLSVSLSFDT
jgi:hypothetical protein